MQRTTFFDHVFKATNFSHAKKKECNRWDLQVLIEVVFFFLNCLFFYFFQNRIAEFFSMCVLAKQRLEGKFFF